MLEAENLKAIADRVRACVEADKHLIEELRKEIRSLSASVRRIQPRSTTALSFVATDGGNNSMAFDPFLVQVIRVVDSSRNEYCLDAVTPNTDIAKGYRVTASRRSVPVDGARRTHERLWVSPPLVPQPHDAKTRRKGPAQPLVGAGVSGTRRMGDPLPHRQEQRLRDRHHHSVRRTLRSKVFSKPYFIDTLKRSTNHRREETKDTTDLFSRLAKHSKVISRYRLAMYLEGTMLKEYPVAAAVPNEIEEKSYAWKEYSRTALLADQEGGEANKFVGGVLHLVKFGKRQVRSHLARGHPGVPVPRSG